MRILWLIFLFGLCSTKFVRNDDEDLGEFAEFEVADEDSPSSTMESILEVTDRDNGETEKLTKNVQASEGSSDLYEEFEDDEFESIETATKSYEESDDKKDKNGEQKLEIKPLTFADIPSHFRSNWSSYQVEALALVVIFFYVLSYIYGKSRNHAIASNWLAQNQPFLEQQFALVGDDGVSQEPTGGHLIRETDSNFSVWCSGRVGCQGMLSQLRLQKRQDLFSHVMNFFRPRKDRVIHRVELDRGEMDSFVFILGQRKTVVASVKELTDLQTFTKERRNADRFGGLPASFAIFAEVAETIPAIINVNVLNFIKKYEKYIDYFHFSDQYSGPRPADDSAASVQLPDVKPTLHFSFHIIPDESEDSSVYANLMQFMFFMVDRVRSYRLSREGKNKADRTRKSVAEAFLKTTHQQRQEAAQARREERARERKQRVMEEEDPDKQRRLEKLEQKREAKLRQPRMKQVRIK